MLRDWIARSRAIQMLAAAALMVAAGPRSAMGADPAGPVYAVEIGGQGATNSIELNGPGGPVDCGARCSVDLHSGRYHLVVTDNDGHRFPQWLDVGGPRRVTVAPGSQGARIAGGMMFVVGVAGIAAGGAMLVSTVAEPALENFGPGDDSFNARPHYIAAAITIAASVAVTVVGRLLWHGRGSAKISDASTTAPAM